MLKVVEEKVQDIIEINPSKMSEGKFDINISNLTNLN